MKINTQEGEKSIIQSRFKSLFEFLKAYNDLRTPVVRGISQQIATLWLRSLPKRGSKVFHQGGHTYQFLLYLL